MTLRNLVLMIHMNHPLAVMFYKLLIFYLLVMHTMAFVVQNGPSTTRRAQILKISEFGSEGKHLQRQHLVTTSCCITILALAGLALPSPRAPVTGPSSSITPIILTSPDQTNSALALSSSPWQESISGFIAGGAMTTTKTVVKYPLDTVTVRLQMPPTNGNNAAAAALFTDLYAGIWNPLITNIPAGAVFFAVKDAVKTFLQQQNFFPMSKTTITCIAVLIANIPYWIMRNPSEVIKTREQAAAVVYVSTDADNRKFYEMDINRTTTCPPTITSIMSEWKHLYVGYFENILYSYPADLIKFLVYDYLLSPNTNEFIGFIVHDPSSLEGAALAGAIATALGQYLTSPLDVVRNRVMTKTTTTKASDSVTHNYFELLMRIYHDEGGVAAWFKGSIPSVGKALISGAIQFVTYEETKLQIMHWFGGTANG